MSDNILLEREQEELLVTLARAQQSVPRHERQKFVVLEFTGDGGSEHALLHDGLPEGMPRPYFGDIETLARQGLISLAHVDQHKWEFDVTPKGLLYAERVTQRQK